MKKKELLPAILEKNESFLTSLIFQKNQMSLHKNYDFVNQNVAQEWFGNILYRYLKKNKIKESDIMFLFSLKNEQGRTWFDFISHEKLHIYNQAGLSFLLRIAEKGYLSRENLAKIIFEIFVDKWNFVTAIARDFETCRKTLLKIFKWFANSNKDFVDLVDQLSYTVTGGWNLFHFLCAEEKVLYQDNLFLRRSKYLESHTKNQAPRYLKFLSDRMQTSSDAERIFNLLTTENDDKLTPIDIGFAKENSATVWALLLLFKKIYQLDSSLLEKLVSQLAGRQQSLYRSEGSLIKLQEFISCVYTANYNTLPMLITNLIIGTKSFLLLSRLAKEKTYPQFEQALLEMVKGYLYQGLTKDNSSSVTTWLIPMLFMVDENGLSYCHYKALTAAENFAVTLEVLEILMNKDCLRPIILGYLCDQLTKDKWTILNLLVRYDQAEKLTTSFCRLIFTSEQDSDYLAKTLKSIFTYKNKEPFLPYLMVAYKSAVFCEFFLNLIKVEILNDRKLLNLFLKVAKDILLNNELKEKSSWLLTYLESIIEKGLGSLALLSAEEKRYVEFFASREVAVANYLLHKMHYPDSSRLIPTQIYSNLERACLKNYNIALMERCVILPTKMLESFDNATKFVSSYLRSIAYITPADSEKLLTRALTVYENQPEIIFLVGDHFYRYGNFSRALEYFNKISYREVSLNDSLHGALGLCYGHMFHETEADVYFYLSYKHNHLATSLGYTRIPELLLSPVKPNAEKPLILIELEDLAKKHTQEVATTISMFLKDIVGILLANDSKQIALCANEACEIIAGKLQNDFNIDKYNQFFAKRQHSLLLLFKSPLELDIVKLLSKACRSIDHILFPGNHVDNERGNYVQRETYPSK